MTFPLFDLLLEGVEFGGGEELTEGDLKPVAEFFEGDGAGIQAFAVEDALNGGLRNTGEVAEAVWREPALFAELANAKNDGFVRIHPRSLPKKRCFPCHDTSFSGKELVILH